MSRPVCAVPAGDYIIGDDRWPFSGPAHSVTLAAFHVGFLPVTNEQFALFIQAGGYQDARWWTEMGWRWQKSKRAAHPAFWHDPWFNGPALPVVGICWYEAAAYARWFNELTGQPWRLPSEAEWEAAARAPSQPDHMPDAAQINSVERGLGRPIEIPENISWCGAANLAGNVWEWTSSRWGRNWQTLDYPYPYAAADGRETLSGSHARIIRGGSWFDPLSQAHPANRGRFLPGSRASNIGFRLIYSAS